MLLQPNGLYNDLSPELRKELEEKVRSFGKIVRYKFDISNPNPDPEKFDGKTVWPNCYTLDPAVFNIVDKDEAREGKSKSKRIGLVDGFDERGMPNKFMKIKVYGRSRGELVLKVEDVPEEFDMAMYLELHPKLVGGKFADPTKRQLIKRIDERAAATEERETRKARKKAMDVAETMSDADIIQFADAMTWDSAEDLMKLRNMTESLAETDPSFFNDLVESKNLEYRATVKQAINKRIIAFDPAENKFIWTSNNQVLAVLQFSNKNEIEALSDWLQGSGSKENEIYKKIKSLIGSKEKTPA